MNHELFRKLVLWRNDTAQRSGVERFKILQNKTVELIAEEAPTTYEALADIKGIGKKKLAEFGSEILALVRECHISSPHSPKTYLQEGDFSNPSIRNRLPLEDSPLVSVEKANVEAGEDMGIEKVFSVSGFLNYLNGIFAERTVLVRGEVSSVQTHPSGIYFTLKDKTDESVMNCYIRPSTYERFGVFLEEGMEVKVGGTPNIYKPKGRLSFLVYTLELAGEGTLKKAYEMLKKKLEQEGLFDRKRPLPEFIGRVGIITSRTGAVIDDFRKNLYSMGFSLYFYDARVEGVRAVDEVLGGIRWFNAHMPDLDVLVIIRGGGSLEDLQAFNNELVARAVFGSKIPTLCGIGHDRDVPIVSLVADKATSTPSIAAMTINESWRRLREGLPILTQDVAYSFETTLADFCVSVDESFGKLLGYVEQLFLRYTHMEQQLRIALGGIEMRMNELRRKSNEFGWTLVQVLERTMREWVQKLASFETYLDGANPERNLKLGYSIIRNKEGKVVRGIEDIKVGEKITAKLYEGEFISKVEEVNF